MNFLSKKIFILLLLSLILFIAAVVIAGTDLARTTAPEPSMYTLEDIYNLIHADSLYAPVVPGSHNIYPSSAPTATTSYSVSQIYADLANLIKRENVATGTIYLGVTGSFDTTDPDYATTTVITSSFIPDPASIQGEAYGYSLEDIWNLIDSNATTTAGNHDATPTTPPASSMHTLTQIYDALLALASEKAPNVRDGVTYLGVEGTYVPEPPDLCSHSATDQDCWSELSSPMVWGPPNTVTGVSSTTDGRGNTGLLSGLDGDYPAADYCAGIEDGGYTDWYLPAKDELLEGRIALGLDIFPVNDYWSSSESTDTPDNKAWELFSMGAAIYDNDKQFMDLVRCLR
jgi:hypothetical protein